MALNVGIGISQASDSLDAGKQAARQALEALGSGKTGRNASIRASNRTSLVIGFLIVSESFILQDVITGVTQEVGSLPLLGFTTSCTLFQTERMRRSVVLAIMGGSGIQAQSGLWENFAVDSRAALQNMFQFFKPDLDNDAHLLLVGDGLNINADFIVKNLAEGDFKVTGCMTGGENWRGRTHQVGGHRFGSGCLAAAALSGDVIIGQGAAHGWQPVGNLVRITRVQQEWIREIDHQLPSDLYGRLFGVTPTAWARPPLNDLVRLYPLGVWEDQDFVVRSPVRMEADGSLRLNAAINPDCCAEVLVGSPERCRNAAAEAAREALHVLGPTQPQLAIIFVDTAWGMLLELTPDAEIEAVRSVIGKDVPILGGYTFGQILRKERSSPIRCLNQHILVLLFGSPSIDSRSDLVA